MAARRGIAAACAVSRGAATRLCESRLHVDIYIPRRCQMKSMIAVVVATALAMPLATLAAGEKSPGTAASPSGASGAEAMFKSMDKNNDGSISRDEAKGTPHEKDFAALDKNHDG